MTGPKKAAAKSSARKRRGTKVRASVVVHPLDAPRSVVGPDGKRRGASGRALKWAYGIRYIAAASDRSKQAVRDAIKAKTFDPSDPLSVAAYVCSCHEEWEAAGVLRRLAKAQR